MKVRDNRPIAVSEAFLFLALIAPPAMAYVGPGAGLGILGTLLAAVAVMLATLVGIVLLPIRAVKRRWKMKASNRASRASETPDKRKT
jgi:hypothetical protein